MTQVFSVLFLVGFFGLITAIAIGTFVLLRDAIRDKEWFLVVFIVFGTLFIIGMIGIPYPTR